MPYMLSHSVVSNSLWPHGLGLSRLLCPWNFLGKTIGAGCHFLFQGNKEEENIFKTELLDM